MGIGTTELIVILVIILVLFGGAKLPKLGRSLGEAMRGFKEGLKGDESKKDEPKPKSDETPKKDA